MGARIAHLVEGFNCLFLLTPLGEGEPYCVFLRFLWEEFSSIWDDDGGRIDATLGILPDATHALEDGGEIDKCLKVKQHSQRRHVGVVRRWSSASESGKTRCFELMKESWRLPGKSWRCSRSPAIPHVFERGEGSTVVIVPGVDLAVVDVKPFLDGTNLWSIVLG